MKLSYNYDKRTKDFTVRWPDHKANGNLLMSFFSQNQEFLNELDNRGYNLKTLRFEIKKKDFNTENNK